MSIQVWVCSLWRAVGAPQQHSLKEWTELRTSLVVVSQPAVLQDLDVTDIQCEVICPLMAFMRRRLYKQP